MSLAELDTVTYSCHQTVSDTIDELNTEMNCPVSVRFRDDHPAAADDGPARPGRRLSPSGRQLHRRAAGECLVPRLLGAQNQL